MFLQQKVINMGTHLVDLNNPVKSTASAARNPSMLNSTYGL